MLPFVNGIAERAVKSVRFEMLNHIQVHYDGELQWYLDQYKIYYNDFRVHQSLDGNTPKAISENANEATVIDISTLGRRKIVRRSFAHGLLNGYVLADEESLDTAA
jgi:hypothetical protein